MSDPKKVKRRVVPTQIIDEPASTKGALDKGEWSTRMQDHYKSLHQKDAVQKIRERAVAMGYEKERKPRIRKSENSRSDNSDHGSHHEHLHSFSEYVKHFASMKNHSKGVTLLDYLRKNYEKNMYLSSKTKRFRRSK